LVLLLRYELIRQWIACNKKPILSLWKREIERDLDCFAPVDLLHTEGINIKTLIICVSIHHGNTQEIAKAMTDVLNADILEPVNVDISNLVEYDLIGFGSGIYGWKHHNSLLNLIDKLPHTNKKTFIFSTRGNLIRIVPLKKYHNELRSRLLKKGFEIIGEYSCLGFDTSGPLGFVGGKNKGHPDEKDLDDARKFAVGLKSGSKFTEIMGS